MRENKPVLSTPDQGKGAGGGKSRKRGNMRGTGIAQHKGWDTKVQERSFVIGPRLLFSLSLTHNPLSCATICSGTKDILTPSISVSFDLFHIFVKSPIYKNLKQTQQVTLFSTDQSRA